MNQIKIFVHMLIEIIIYFHWIRSSWVQQSYLKSLYYNWFLVRLLGDQQVFMALLPENGVLLKFVVISLCFVYIFLI